MALLDLIQKENDIKQVPQKQLPALAEELRAFLVRHVAKTGGHLASNLGAVELCMALHLTFTLPEDKLIWDVGHQSYVHKILTGRKDAFDTLRQLDGLSGFPKRAESASDCFDTGHSSTSISAGLGFARARDLLGESHSVVSVIGDGALTGGLAYDALNTAAELKTNFIIVLNDNNMSISQNVGGLSRHLTSLRTAAAYQELKSDVQSSLAKLPCGERVVRRISKTKSSLKQLLIPGMLFENMGITYLGPVNGHSLPDLLHVLGEAKKVNGAVVVHVLTNKGEGYAPAKAHPDRFHGIGAFDVQTGRPEKKQTKQEYTDVFGAALCRLANKEHCIVAITAAMADGTGLKRFRKEFPERFFDVGIAEGHAVTFAAGLCAAGMRPVFAVYSSFLQRGFDEVMHDVCIQKLPVVFCLDRAGLVGADGETHQGIFDLSFLSMMPNMTVLAPKNKWELGAMLSFALSFDGPVAIRYPKGEAYDGLESFKAPLSLGKAEWLYEETDVAIFAVGAMVESAEKVRELLKKEGIGCSVINARFVKPLDKEAVCKAAAGHRLLVTMEENVLCAGFGAAVSAVAGQAKVLSFGIEDAFVPQGKVSELKQRLGLSPVQMAEKILEVLA